MSTEHLNFGALFQLKSFCKGGQEETTSVIIILCSEIINTQHSSQMSNYTSEVNLLTITSKNQRQT